MAEDTYRIRLVLERCVHTAIGNWQDTQELNSHIFVVSNNKSKVESEYNSLKAKADSQPALLEALEMCERARACHQIEKIDKIKLQAAIAAAKE